jgi:hypothetical protein
MLDPEQEIQSLQNNNPGILDLLNEMYPNPADAAKESRTAYNLSFRATMILMKKLEEIKRCQALSIEK